MQTPWAKNDVRDDGSTRHSGVEPDVLCFSHLRWHFVYQRPQHLLTRCAAERRVFFWEEPVYGMTQQNRLEVIREQENLFVLKPHLREGADVEAEQRVLLQEFLREYGVKRLVRWYYTPMALGFTRELQADATVYDCMDELSGFQGAPPALREREQELFAAADVVFTGGMSLYDAKRKQHDNVHAFPSSIDAAHFRSAERRDGAGGPGGDRASAGGVLRCAG